MYFEDARLELFGWPIAYFPYLWTPDPTVKRKTGFLQPNIVSGTKFGFGATIPFFWNLAPDYDVTLTPMPTTKQGLMMMGEWRHRLINGAYSIRAAGIFQEDKNTFAGQPGFRDFRGAVETRGDFRLSEKWFYGWDASIFTDSAFAPDYKVIKGNAAEAVSQFYLFGRGAKSYFDTRFLHFYGFSPLWTTNGSCRSSSRWSTTSTSTVRRSSAASWATTSTSPASTGDRPTSIRSPRPRRRTAGAIWPGLTPCGRRRTACCAEFPAPTRASPRKPIGSGPSSIRSGKCSRRSCRCAATLRLLRSPRNRRSATSSRPARAASAGPCRRSVSNIATRSSARTRGARRRSSRSPR